ncbi:MAG TPA: hypothetical protein DCR55_04705 [Lentisphaeria bacterium]|mgnify:FL=1|jgi:secondary thiamine-phosphate synthase enzyme|nr:hypothetical protein [Lentisphaeria bacterium]
MGWAQRQIVLRSRDRGFHLVTDELICQVPEIAEFAIGLAHVFIQHTSAALTLNENADPTVRADFERYFRHAVADDTPFFVHRYEGPDDMPAHIKASLLGPSVTIPIRNGKLQLGTWQGIYLCEHRIRGGGRRIVVTLTGESLA